MNERSPLRRRLLENHFSFTALHRAKVIRQPDFVRWESPSEAFRCVLADSQSSLASLTSETSAVRTFPWTGDIAAGLENLGFRGTGCLRYMTLPPDRAAVASAASGPVDFQIRIAETETELGQFSDVQASSFLSPGEKFEPLRAFLHEANLKNLKHPAQTFYVGSLEDKPVAVTLLLTHEGTAGIYAVATLPEFRRRGLSRLLLARAIADGRRRGCDIITLQVHRNSEAERLYLHLGFSVEFDCMLWNRTKTHSQENSQ